MKHVCLFLILFIIQNSYSQEKYHFDYFTSYDYHEKEGEKASYSEITFSNSADTDYYLSYKMKRDSIFNITLVDHKKGIIFRFKNFLSKEINNDSLFKFSESQKVNYEYCLDSKTSFYDVNYITENGNNSINIKQYKNSRKSKLIRESFFETKFNEISKNQHYNFPILTSPLWCNKFRLINDELITKSYFVENKKIRHIRNLKEIQKTDFTLILKNTITEPKR
jgi:hypothetical protein